MLLHTNNCVSLNSLIMQSKDKSYFLILNHLDLLIRLIRLCKKCVEE